MVFQKYCYPTLLRSSNTISSNSWFDIKVIQNNKKTKTKTITIKDTYIHTKKIKLQLTQQQHNKLLKWFDDCIDIYNMTNQHIKNNDLKAKDMNFIDMRKELNSQIKEICSKNNLRKHQGDYAVKHCIEMYKSAFSNLKGKQFNVRNLDKNRRRKNMVIEPANINNKQTSFFQLGNIISSMPLETIKRNSILQYDSYKKSFKICCPVNIDINKKYKKKGKCGIDIGVRTFLTTYSDFECYEIGTNTYDKIDSINNRLDKIQESKQQKIISFKRNEKLNNKYRDKLKNIINDLHNKSANFLLSQYDIINIGKVSTKSMISNLFGNLNKITKRRLVALSHYKFRMKLIEMSEKFKCKVIEINEYMTSKKCCNCNNIKMDLGSNKTYECNKCMLKMDRDINASINIYKL